MLPTRAHSMFSGNNNTSYRLTAYLCKNSARGGIWSALVLFFEITSFRYVPLAVVMFSLPYQFCRDGKFYYRAYLVCHSQMPSLQVAFGEDVGGCRHFFPRFLSLSLFLFYETVLTVCVCMWGSPTPTPPPPPPPLSLPKKKGKFFSKKKRKKAEWENDKSLCLCYWNILTALGSLTFYYRR